MRCRRATASMSMSSSGLTLNDVGVRVWRLMRARAQSILLRGPRPSAVSGFVVTVILAGVCTGMVYPLKLVAPVSSLGVVYLLGVVVVSAFWGLWLGIAMSVLSTAAFNFFHLPPLLRFTLADERNWVALGVLLAAAVATSSVSEVMRSRAFEAERRRAEADLTAEMAQLLLARVGVGDALALIGQRLAEVFELRWASIVLGEVQGDRRRQAIALEAVDGRAGTLVVPAGLSASVVARLRERVVPALTAMLKVALDRERLVAEAVRTEGLRRSEAVKTAVLRAVSHDLRTPVTAMITAAEAVRAPELPSAERDSLATLVVEEGNRLARLIDDLLDLSKLEAHAAVPRLAECSVEEVIDAALASQPPEAAFEVRIAPELGSVRADFVQVERALANLLENAARYSGGEPVTIRARTIGGRTVIRVVDRGPGIPVADQERIFEPFYRSPSEADDGHAGSGLGLAIAKGFVETNGGRLSVESTPGQGSAFVVELLGNGKLSS
jgi:two-component system, OmpR family, sensor histidine kinase KdpD